uniref:Conserved oligomeric Golgi complex subunit 6 n=1 Tax=Tetraselmis sp. GSL018 TaxID=582737 RepID=A0A061SD29_9CHLO
MSGTLAPGLSRKVKKILETKVDSPELLSSLATLSEIHPSNTPAARRRLRATIEKQGLDVAKSFLSDASSVIDAINVVRKELDGLSTACDGISKGIEASKQATSGLLEETSQLKRKLAISERRSELVVQFLSSYQLSEEEIEALSDHEVGDEFFKALERVREIHGNCRSLLHGAHQRAGLEIMDAMGAHQEAAYEKLCRWVQQQCRALGSDDAPEVDGTLRKAAHVLQQRPVLFKYCAEEVATSRHNALFQRFIAALTRGGPGGTPRPIEMHAHDPRRYVGDMLAWVHQSLASEHELFVSLFGEHKDDRGPSVQDAECGSSTEMATTSLLLDRVFESICRPLKVRVEQVLMSSPSMLLCYRLSHLLAFYGSTVRSILGEEAQLFNTLKGCKEMAARIFFEQLKSKGDHLLRNPPPPPSDLSPPSQVSEAIRLLLDILEVSETGVEQPSNEATGAEAERVLTAGLDPLLTMCEKSAEALSADAPSRVDEQTSLDPSAQKIYQINCLHAIQTLLGRRPCMDSWTARLAELIEGHTASLVGTEVGRILSRAGLSEILERIRLHQESGSDTGAMADEPALQKEKVAEALKGFFSAVSEPDILPAFNALQAPRVRAQASDRVARHLADAYSTIYSALTDPANGYSPDGDASAIVKHNPDQVATILGVS